MVDKEPSPEIGASLEDAAREFLRLDRIAVAGVSREPRAAANAIYRKLRKAGKSVVAVNPHAAEVEGDPCFHSLSEVAPAVDGVVVVTPPADTKDVVRECIQSGIRQVWIHQSFGRGSMSMDAVALGRANGVRVIPGGCPLMFCDPVDFGHRCIRWILGRTGSLPRSC